MNERSEQQVRGKREALRQIDLLKGQHYQRVFHAASDTAFAAHAQDVLKCFRIAFPNNPLQVQQSMRSLADYIEQCALEYPDSNGHHHRAAEQIRLHAEGISPDLCPWRDLRTEFGRAVILRNLADQLWLRNTAQSKKWSADYQDVVQAVWADELKERSAIASATSRLCTWLKKTV